MDLSKNQNLRNIESTVNEIRKPIQDLVNRSTLWFEYEIMNSQTIEAQVQYKNPKTITVKTADFHINLMS